MPELPLVPPVWEPHTTHLTQERMHGFKLTADGFLWPEEVRLFEFIIDHHQEAFAWTEGKRRRFRSDYVPPIRYPVVPHEPWEDRNRPIPPGIQDELIKLLKDRIAAGVSP
ncbi:hypothetical protein AURDEDRAFT_72544 [Auricularia subglabra TFB-10046 SS5]|nr:hypothetical protein AURDEDRAFT_72544 [Auricularia subglabra TFB-10046 SS5]